ncbi:hypothetical protein [Bradyrhizobium sp. 192]|uniref:hypothetical protein n=1 Tax=Bradyrhizobium sp. 192 TaxID=2782660 RepID=UPI001FFE3243|nr:hypothetical protein [Bradyrhizobium sp. 192]UPJ58684.1 hypothetical protein IVB24_02265 [Bradyrhizobium sp. 192]
MPDNNNVRPRAQDHDLLHAEIARRYSRQPDDQQQRISLVAARRIRDLELYLECRYGKVLPEGDDAAREDLVILLNHLAQNPYGAFSKMRHSIQLWAPWMHPVEAGIITDMVLRRPRRYGAAKLGDLLGLTVDEHARLMIWTIRAVGVTDAALKEKRQCRDRMAKAAKRAMKPLKRPRGRPKLNKPGPWLALGLSRATYHRHKAAGKLPGSLPGDAKNGSPRIEDGPIDTIPFRACTHKRHLSRVTRKSPRSVGVGCL